MSNASLFLLFCCACHFCFAQPSRPDFLDPTGTYILKGEKQRGEIVGNFAEIRIKLLSDSSIAFTFYFNKGYPDYKSGSLIDTVQYLGNNVMYSSTSDTSCQIQFAFDHEGLHIKTIYTNPSSTCGFEQGVLPLGFIPKSSSSIPIIQRLTRPH